MIHSLKVCFSTQKPEHDYLRSKLVRFFDGVPYSHTFLILDGLIVFHAVGEGVVTTTLDELQSEAIIVKKFVFQITPEQSQYLHGYIQGCVGKRYSRTQLLAIILAKNLKIDHALWRNGTKEYICSELCADVLAEIGFDIGGCHDLVTPRELMKFLEAQDDRLQKSS